MSKASIEIPCTGCEFSKPFIVASSGVSKRTDITIGSEGNIMYSESSPCGIAIGNVSANDMRAHYPNLLERVMTCESSGVEVLEMPRGGILGVLGMTKLAEVRKCNATNAEELENVIEETKGRRETVKANIGIEGILWPKRQL